MDQIRPKNLCNILLCTTVPINVPVFILISAIKGSAPDLFRLCNLGIVQKADQHPVKKRPFSCLNGQMFRNRKNARKFNTSDYVVDKEAGLQRGASIYEGIMLQAELSH